MEHSERGVTNLSPLPWFLANGALHDNIPVQLHYTLADCELLKSLLNGPHAQLLNEHIGPSHWGREVAMPPARESNTKRPHVVHSKDL